MENSLLWTLVGALATVITITVVVAEVILISRLEGRRAWWLWPLLLAYAYFTRLEPPGPVAALLAGRDSNVYLAIRLALFAVLELITLIWLVGRLGGRHPDASRP